MTDVTNLHYWTKYKVQPIEFFRKDFKPDEFRGYLKGNTIKYIMRYQDKNKIEDLEKAKVYLQWLIDFENELIANDVPHEMNIKMGPVKVGAPTLTCEPPKKEG